MNKNNGNFSSWAWALIALFLVVWLDSLAGFMNAHARRIVIQAGAIYCLAFGGNLLLKRIPSGKQ